MHSFLFADTLGSTTRSLVIRSLAGLKKHDMLNRKTAAPRGILHVPKDAPLVGLERFEPSPSLAPFIEHYWSVTWERQPKVLRETVPHPSIHMVFQRDATELHGIHRRRFSKWIEGTGRVLGVKFRPGGFRAFTTDAVKSLTDTVVHPSIVFGASILDLDREVLRIGSAEVAFEKIDSYLARREPLETDDFRLASRIVEAVSSDRSITRAEMIADRFNLGIRKLQRMFLEYVGVSPKWVIQRFRLIEAAERIRASETELDFADFALQLSYSDQSHFIRDFKVMVGMTPAKYRESLIT